MKIHQNLAVATAGYVNNYSKTPANAHASSAQAPPFEASAEVSISSKGKMLHLNALAAKRAHTNTANVSEPSPAEQNEATETKKTHEKWVKHTGNEKHNKSTVYNKNGYKVDYDMINATKAEMKNNVGAFKVMAEAAHKNKTHGIKHKDSNHWSDWVHKQLGKQYTVNKAETPASDGGYWGVEQTSQRIVDFAKSLSGGDAANYDKLLNAIKKGFGAAKNAWGGKMPGITGQTYNAVMEKMEAWKEELYK